MIDLIVIQYTGKQKLKKGKGRFKSEVHKGI